MGDPPGGDASAEAIHRDARRRNRRAISAMVLASVLYGISDAAMKVVAGSIPAGQSVFLRSVGVVAVIGFAAVWSGALGALARLPLRLTGMRGACDAGNSIFFQTALARMSLPDAMAILQLAPLSMTALSALVLGARVGWRRWLAVAVGLVGALLIIKPGTSAFNPFALLVILSVLCGAGRDATTRFFDRALPPLALLLASQAAVVLITAGYGLLETWVVPSARQMAQLAVGALFFAGGHLATIYAVRDSDWSVVAPFRYTGIVWVIFLGFVIWGDVPDSLSFLGIAILIGAGLYTLHRERMVVRGR
jgi:drug/metabolite transporter (DMT)-like permease